LQIAFTITDGAHAIDAARHQPRIPDVVAQVSTRRGAGLQTCDIIALP